MKGLLVTAVFVGIFALACGEAEQPTTSEPAGSPTATEPPTPLSQTAPPAPTPPGDLADQIQACAAGKPTASDAAVVLNACLASGTILANAAPAEGTADVVLLDVISNPRCFFTESFVLWKSGTDWSVESLESIIPSPDGGTAFASGSLAWPHSNEGRVRARVVGSSPSLQLGMIYLEAGCGSGPHDSFALLSLEAGHWILSWNGSDSEISNVAHTQIRFRGKGIDGLDVSGDSWTRHDPQSRIFFESNAGPHRLFEQTWARQGDSYTLLSEVLSPSPYAAMVDFVYRLSVGDLAGARAMVVDPSLLESAFALSIAQDPVGQEWLAACGDGGPLSPPPCVIQKREGAAWDGYVKVDLTQSGPDWVISAVTDYTPTPAP